MQDAPPEARGERDNGSTYGCLADAGPQYTALVRRAAAIAVKCNFSISEHGIRLGSPAASWCDIKLDSDAPLPGLPDELGPFLSALIAGRPGAGAPTELQPVLNPLNGVTMPPCVPNWMRTRLPVVARHRPYGRRHSPHNRGRRHALALCGGINAASERWDTSELCGRRDLRRIRPSGRLPGFTRERWR